MNLKRTEGPGCDAVSCKTEWELRLQEGATLLNPNRRVKLCQIHWMAWLAEEDKLRRQATITGPLA